MLPAGLKAAADRRTDFIIIEADLASHPGQFELDLGLFQYVIGRELTELEGGQVQGVVALMSGRLSEPIQLAIPCRIRVSTGALKLGGRNGNQLGLSLDARGGLGFRDQVDQPRRGGSYLGFLDRPPIDEAIHGPRCMDAPGADDVAAVAPDIDALR